MGPRTMHLLLHLSQTADGTVGCSLDAVEQKSNALPCGDVTAQDRTVSLGIPSVGGSWSGTLAADGKTMAGNMTQAGHQMPLTFVKQ